jgi:hypothetical protein
VKLWWKANETREKKKPAPGKMTRAARKRG